MQLTHTPLASLHSVDAILEIESVPDFGQPHQNHRPSQLFSYWTVVDGKLVCQWERDR